MVCWDRMLGLQRLLKVLSPKIDSKRSVCGILCIPSNSFLNKVIQGWAAFFCVNETKPLQPLFRFLKEVSHAKTSATNFILFWCIPTGRTSVVLKAAVWPVKINHGAPLHLVHVSQPQLWIESDQLQAGYKSKVISCKRAITSSGIVISQDGGSCCWWLLYFYHRWIHC